MWVLNYSAHGSKPDGIDIGLYGTGFFGAISSVAAIGTGTMKAAVDDEIDTKLREVQAGRTRVTVPSSNPATVML